jgi:hypothetical protein
VEGGVAAAMIGFRKHTARATHTRFVPASNLNSSSFYYILIFDLADLEIEIEEIEETLHSVHCRADVDTDRHATPLGALLKTNKVELRCFSLLMLIDSSALRINKCRNRSVRT